MSTDTPPKTPLKANQLRNSGSLNNLEFHLYYGYSYWW